MFNFDVINARKVSNLVKSYVEAFEMYRSVVTNHRCNQEGALLASVSGSVFFLPRFLSWQQWGRVGESGGESSSLCDHYAKFGNWTKNANFKRLALMDITVYGNPKLGTVCLMILAAYDLALFSRCTVKNN